MKEWFISRKNLVKNYGLYLVHLSQEIWIGYTVGFTWYVLVKSKIMMNWYKNPIRDHLNLEKEKNDNRKLSKVLHCIIVWVKIISLREELEFCKAH